MNWHTLQPKFGIVDVSSRTGAVTVAAGASKFADISAPTVFRFPSHYARLSKGMIAIVRPEGATFCVLVRVVDLFEKDILIQWEVRNCD